jgi:hypothetical protein
VLVDGRGGPDGRVGHDGVGGEPGQDLIYVPVLGDELVYEDVDEVEADLLEPRELGSARESNVVFGVVVVIRGLVGDEPGAGSFDLVLEFLPTGTISSRAPAEPALARGVAREARDP